MTWHEMKGQNMTWHDMKGHNMTPHEMNSSASCHDNSQISNVTKLSPNYDEKK